MADQEPIDCQGTLHRQCHAAAVHNLCDTHFEMLLDEAVENATSNEYYIWSNEHDAWWAPKCNGYVQNVANAGTYSYKEALQICTEANHLFQKGYNPKPNEVMVPKI